MTWNLQGRFIEVCSCKLMCPCWMGPGAEPDRGWCSGSFIVDIQRGSSGELELSGLKVAMLGDWPKDFASGGATVRWFIDDAATSQQHQELELIFTGARGGAWERFSAIVADFLPTLSAKIEVEWGDKPTARVGNVATITLDPVKDADGQQAQMRGAPAMKVLEFDTLNLARSDGSTFAGPDLRKWDSGGEGEMTTFNWSG